MREEFLNIWIHGDEWLEEILSRKILSREKLHHWPLSYVEAVTLSDNTRFVYKSQRSASSVEKDFYSKVKKPFLVSPIYSGTYESCDILILPYLNYPTLGDVSENELDQIISNTNKMIQSISDMPTFYDLSSVDKLVKIVDTVSVNFEEKSTQKELGILKKWISEKSHVCYDNRIIGNVHGDLIATNIMIEDGKPRYILDWQRPMTAPVLLENAIAFKLAGHDPVKKYGDLGILAVICQFIWFSYASIDLLPFVADIAENLLIECATLIGSRKH